LGLQLPDRAIEARERLRPFVALVETFVDDDAERLDESETFGIGRAQTGGIVGALLAGSDLSIRTLTLLVMASHSSACAAAAAKPSAAAVITAARIALLLIMLSPQPVASTIPTTGGPVTPRANARA
jgi:hypothetical protein